MTVDEANEDDVAVSTLLNEGAAEVVEADPGRHLGDSVGERSQLKNRRIIAQLNDTRRKRVLMILVRLKIPARIMGACR